MSKIIYKIIHFGLLDKKQQIDILECFKKEKEVLIFQHFILDVDSIDEESKKYQKEIYYEDFCQDFIYFYDVKLKQEIENKIKEILFVNVNRECCNNIINNDKEMLKLS